MWRTRAAERPSAQDAHVSWFVHRGRDTAPVRVWVVAPASPAPIERITIAMPGTMRNAEDYARGWRAFCDQSVVLVPEFTRTDWPGSRQYALGNVTRGRSEGRGRNPRHCWSFTVVEEIHRGARRHFGVEDEGFVLWGHSAGAQFVHRMALFCPDAPVHAYIAAGAGWYTVPDPAIAFPYGLGDAPVAFTSQDIAAFAAQPLTLMRGTHDTERDAHLKTSPEAEQQGANRYERAGYMLRKGHAADPRCGWRLLDVSGAAHEPTKMAAAAQSLLRSREC